MNSPYRFNVILILIFTLFALNSVISQVRNIGVPISKQISKFELGIRYLKLGNTYREAKEFHLAKKYLDKGYNLIKLFGNNYWEAAANEFFGYLFRDMELWVKSLEHLQIASNIYSRIIKLDGGSNDAISQVIEKINDYSNRTKDKVPIDNDNEIQNSKKINETENKLKMLEIENKKLTEVNFELIKTNKNLSEQISILEKNIEVYKSKLKSQDKSEFPTSYTNPKEKVGSITELDSDLKNHTLELDSSIKDSNISIITGHKIKDYENDKLSDKEKELKLMKTGYSYKQGNVIVDMYGNKIYLDK